MSTVCFTATAGVAIPLLLGCALLATAERFWSGSCSHTKTPAVRRVAPVYKYEGGRDVSSKSVAVTASQVSGCTDQQDHSVRWLLATRLADGAPRWAGNHLRHHLLCVAVLSSFSHTHSGSLSERARARALRYFNSEVKHAVVNRPTNSTKQSSWRSVGVLGIGQGVAEWRRQAVWTEGVECVEPRCVSANWAARSFSCREL